MHATEQIINFDSIETYRINQMYILEKKDAEKILFALLKRTLKRQSDIDYLIGLARSNEHSIPMKGIRHKYDSMEKYMLTGKDRDELEALMYFYGP